MKNRAWGGDYVFLLSNLMQKDFKIRYRNMSLGVFWSLLNPLVTMFVLTFVWTQIFKNPEHNYPVRILCGLVPFNFFSFAWGIGTNSLVDGSAFVKRVAIPREIIPIASVFSNCLHMFIQIGLLLFITLVFGNRISLNWLWLPLVWGLFIVFVCGLTLITSALNVFVRDIRYLVESFNTVLFWLVPIVYSFDIVPDKYKPIYEFNPVSAMVFALRRILVEGGSPAISTIRNLALVSFAVLILGFIVFGQLRRKFYDYL